MPVPPVFVQKPPVHCAKRALPTQQLFPEMRHLDMSLQQNFAAECTSTLRAFVTLFGVIPRAMVIQNMSVQICQPAIESIAMRAQITAFPFVHDSLMQMKHSVGEEGLRAGGALLWKCDAS